MQGLETIFGPDGSLAKQIPAYRPRSAQLEMAQAVAQAIAQGQCLVAEAGTGTGKTLAYLIPALLSGKKIIVSTGTKNLQEQLFRKELPAIRSALAMPFRAALLKGRGNYLCHYRLQNALQAGFHYRREDAAALETIRQWSGQTSTGDIGEVVGVPEASLIWPSVTSTVDNCLGQECPFYKDCFLVKARREALDAEILIINHHLLCADWSLRKGEYGELLPDAEVVIVDEAHQLAEIAAQFLGNSIGSRQLNELAKDLTVEQLKNAPDLPDLHHGAQRLERQVRELRAALGDALGRAAWRELAENPAVLSRLHELIEHLQDLAALLEQAAVRSKGLESCWKRCMEMTARLRAWLEEEEAEWIRWYETFQRSFTLSCTPLHIAGQFKQFVEDSGATWIFTSATLAVAGRFEHFLTRLGLEEAKTQRWESPFDYQSQSLLYQPPQMPDPTSPNFVKAAAEAALPVLKASQGRAFFLFTSHRALLEAAAILADQLDFPLYIQGSQPKTVLLERFTAHGHAVLLGTASFWEGVDVRGPALSCVIIDKLPFASPGDPVLQARLDNLRQQGQNPFAAYQLPAAVIALKQGVGRLLRDSRDRGVLMLCDPRLTSRAYGRVFLQSLPPMRRTESLQEVEAFFSAQSAWEAP